MLSFKEKINLIFGIFTLFSTCGFIVSFLQYMQWLKTKKLVEAGLLSEWYLEYDRIVTYDYATKGMIISLILTGLFLTILIIFNIKRKKAGD